jgi:WD40 repeat protein
MARLWDATSGRELRVLRHEASVRFVAFSPDGAQVATLTSGFLSNVDHMRSATVRLWDVETGRELWRKAAAHSWTDRVSFSPDGKSVAASLVSYRDERPEGAPDYRFAGERVFVWDAARGEERLTIEPPKNVGTQVRVAFSRDGKRLVVASHTGAVLLDATSGKPASPTLDAGWHCRAILSPDGKLILTAGEWGHAALWDAVTGERLLDLGTAKVRKEDEEVNDMPAVAFSPDGRRIAVGYPLEGYTSVREIALDPNK